MSKFVTPCTRQLDRIAVSGYGTSTKGYAKASTAVKFCVRTATSRARSVMLKVKLQPGARKEKSRGEHDAADAPAAGICGTR